MIFYVKLSTYCDLKITVCNLYFTTSKRVNSASLKTLYFAWFYSLFNYGIIIWGGEYKSNIQRLISIQNKCFKLINHQHFNDFRTLNLLPIRYNAFFRIILHLYRNKALCDTKVNPYNTRSNEIFQIPIYKKDIFCKHFFLPCP